MRWSQNKKKERTILDDHSSYIKTVLIPLFHFNGYHQTVSEEEGDEDFVGRKAIIGKLKAWLSDPKSSTGAYLITGFRGMGKSSFVGNTLYELTGGKKVANYATCMRFIYWIAIGLVCILSVFGKMSLEAWTELFVLLGLMCLVLSVGRYLFFTIKNKTNFLIIKLNVGNEIMRNREILQLITKATYDKLGEYFSNHQNNCFASFLSLIVKLVFTVYLFYTFPFPHILPGGQYWMSAVVYLLTLASEYPLSVAFIRFFLIYGLVATVGRRVLFGLEHLELLPFTTGHGLLHRLYRLHERSIATVNEDSGSMGQRVFFSLFHRKEFRAPSVHEMEQELISVFADLDKLQFGSPQLVIVLDELDKVSPAPEEPDKEVVPEFNPSVGGLNGKNGPRSRQREVLRMLANMKYFMATARAKFIFIAGRDLYDAYLKDVSDREFSVSSIFNGVINVQSFLKPTSNTKEDILSLTENFVCAKLMKPFWLSRFLPNIILQKKDWLEKIFPEEYISAEKTLQSYYRVEMKKINRKKSEEERKILSRRLSRNVILLHQFILYLVHISNGSPKKIAIHFEKYIRTREYLENVKGYTLDESPSKCRYYLSFGVKEIQKIGFVYYMVYPVTQALINQSKVYEDKLLVSISFMINHIYKYHNTGFSWRNLEHIPELLEINKTPELRDFVGTIVSVLRKTHLTRILSGLYLFKFPMKISEEISFISRHFEDLSALFNFSQDESLSIRSHYINLLNYYSRDINRIEGKELHALASIHHILGDLYQEDEDYSQAIFEYQTGLQLLSRQLQGNDYDSDPHWVSYMLFLVRNMLKLGLTYEKRKTLDSAYLAYSELVQHLVNYRFFEEKKFGLHYQIQDKGGRQDKDALLFFKTKYDSEKAQAMFPGFEEAEQKQGFAFQCDHLKTEFARLLTPLKNSVITRMAFFDDVRMAYLPILAKLSVLEKMNMEGITQHNLDVAEAEFFFLHLATDDSEKTMVAADFYNRFGDIMYYKNGLMGNRTGNIFLSLSFWGYDLGQLKDTICQPLMAQDMEVEQSRKYLEGRKKVECWFNEPTDEAQKNIKDRKGLIEYLKAGVNKRINWEFAERIDWTKIFDDDFDTRIPLRKVSNCVNHRNKFLKKGLRTPCYACKYYNQAMNVELERMMGWEWNAENRKQSKAVIVAKMLLEYDERFRNMRETQCSIIGDTLKGLGCTFMGCADETEVIDDDFLKNFFWLLEFYYEKRPFFMPAMQPGKLEKAMLLFWEASVLYGMTGDNRSVYELNKHLLDILGAYLKVHPEQSVEIGRYLPKIKKLIVNQGIRNWYAHYGHVHLAENQQLKTIFGKDFYENTNVDTVWLSPDVEELVYAYCMLEVYCTPQEKWRPTLYNNRLTGPYKLVCTLTQDVLNLKMKVIMNEQVLVELLKKMEWKSIDRSYPDAACFYQALHGFIEQEGNITVKGLYEKENSLENRIQLLDFLIIDTLFCLGKIVNVLTPLSDTTLYSNSFMGEVYEHLWKWTIVFEWVYLCYKAVDKPKLNMFNALKQRYHSANRLKEEVFMDIVKKLRSLQGNKKDMAEKLKTEVQKKVGIDTFRHLTRTNQIENVIHYYGRSMEVHSEGKAYKEMIRTLFFLDDDLNNDTCQLAFGLERFLINTGWLQSRLDYYREMSTSFVVYDIEKYY